MQVVLVTPPLCKPSEPGLSAAAAAMVLERLGVRARAVDASIAWHRFALAPARLRSTLAAAQEAGELGSGRVAAYTRAIAALAEAPHALRRPATYGDRRRYTSAINHLENAIALVGLPFADLRLGVALVGGTKPGARPEASAWLLARAHAAGPFDDYYCEELIPELQRCGASHVGISVTFQQQMPGALRLAVLVRRHCPSIALWLGGPLIACWQAAARPLPEELVALFDHVGAGNDDELATLARAAGCGDADATAVRRARVAGPLGPSLSDFAWDAYFSPLPTVPLALGPGCYWRRCTFCPDHLHAAHEPCSFDGLDAYLASVAARFPDGAMLHVTDSAVPPAYLSRLADTIGQKRLPLKWHGFVRLEAELADPDFARHLAAGGCTMLQLGVETASPRLLRLMGKGTSPELARRVLRGTRAAGIRNHVYLLFGLPTETDADRELTLTFVEKEATALAGVNPALLNLPKGSPMHRAPALFGISDLSPFHEATDLSLYDDFRCGSSHPRLEARRWLDRRFFKSEAVRALTRDLRSPLKANHLCFFS